MEGLKKRAAEAETVSELESEAESDLESNKELGGEEESKGVIRLSGVEQSRVGQKSKPTRKMTGRNHVRGGATQ